MGLTRFLNGTVFAATLSIFCASVAAQEYPVRPVRVIVPFAAGGPADLFNRFLAQKLTESLGQPFVIENRPGAGAIIGTEAAAKASGDGYTLLAITNNHTTLESLVPTRPYDLMRDFAPIAPIMQSDMVLVINPAVAATTLKELVALSKRESAKLNYASSGVGSGYHMAAELLKAMAGLDALHVPYRNSAAARTDVIGGQVQIMFDATSTMAPQVKSGKVRALATTARERSIILPDVPTVSEAGFDGYEATIWLGIVAPAGTPTTIIERLSREINRILATDEARSTWAAQGATTMGMTPAEFAAFLRNDVIKWAEIVKVSGAKLDP